MTILCEAICRYELASENDCKVLSWIISINKDGNGTQLGAFFEDEISGPTILTVTQGWIRDGHLVFGFLSKYPAGCKEDLAVIAEKKANENGFSLNVTRNTPSGVPLPSLLIEIIHDNTLQSFSEASSYRQIASQRIVNALLPPFGDAP